MNLTVNAFETDFSSEVPVTATITINGNDNGGLSDTHTFLVDDGCPATITVEQAGYHPYSMTIDDVYAVDRTIDVILVPEITDINDPNYLRPRPAFFTFQGICDFCVDAYNASSFPGNITWYVNNIEYSTDNKIKSCFCNPGDFQIKIRNQTSQFVVEVPGCPAVEVQLWDQQFANIFTGNTVSGTIDPIEDYLALDTETNVTVSEYRIDLSLEATSDVAPLEDGDVCCYSRGEALTVTPTIQLNRVNADPDFHTIEFKVIDPEGFTIENPEWVAPLTLYPDISIQFEMSKIGVYTITATVVDLYCDNTFEQSIQVETCNFVYLQYTDCGTYTVTNRSSATEFSYTVVDVADNTTGSLEGTVAPTESAALNLTNQSLFLLEVRYTKEGDTTETVETYVLNNYCSIEQCFTQYIEEILCSPTGRCTPCPPESDLNQMFFFYNTYFMKIHKMFNTNSFYAALDEEGLSEITTIQQLMAKINEYCERMHCSDTGYKNTYVSEGPYDWAGQGSNISKNCDCNPKPSAGYYNPSKPGYCGTCNGKV
jgi:hypothetical protein